MCYAVILYSYIVIFSWQEILNLAGEVQWFVESMQYSSTVLAMWG